MLKFHYHHMGGEGPGNYLLLKEATTLDKAGCCWCRQTLLLHRAGALRGPLPRGGCESQLPALSCPLPARFCVPVIHSMVGWWHLLPGSSPHNPKLSSGAFTMPQKACAHLQLSTNPRRVIVSLAYLLPMSQGWSCPAIVPSATLS